MSGEEKAEKIHRELFKDISAEITDGELGQIKQELKQKAFGGFKAGEIQREFKTTDDVLEKLKRKGLIKIGDYEILWKLAEAIGSEPIRKYVAQAENSLTAIHWPVKRPQLDAPRGGPRPIPMDTYGGYPQQHPTQVHMAHPPQYQYDPHSYNSMGPPQHPVRNSAPHQPYSSFQDSLIMRPPSQPVPRTSSSHPNSYQQGGIATSQMVQAPNPQGSFQGGRMGATCTQQPASVAEEYEDEVFSDDKDDTEYEQGRGYVLFINNFFTGKPEHRRGAEVDEKNINNLFKDVLNRYYLQYEKDVTRSQLQNYLTGLKKTLSTGAYTNFIFILGTHGEPQSNGADRPLKDAVLMADNKWMLVEDIISNFHGDQISKMQDKPKVFIIQSCRGKEKQRGVSSSDGPATELNPETMDYPEPAVTTRPVNSDILIAYATSQSKKAFRNQDNGSWFVEDLCNVIRKYYDKEHILDILVRVNSRMVKREATQNHGKQMPCFVCTFTRRFMLAYPNK
ncbi:caspase-1 [Strongylocentrotus purpuratus]|uniref:Uncharacterized protein n=1 Tax=Strongylocentrotus purpuratus TaxID=7668 RepID=A0A7M7PPR8_STRPU|nr:caspase-1 [Strongylocentrotus purpuratus]